MDNLARDVRMAEKLGYGCHYGWYKADHPHTADLTDEEILGLPVKGKKKKPVAKGPEMTVCRWCGKSFPTSRHGRQYCNDDCRRYAYEKVKRERKKAAVQKNKICVICGGPITGRGNRKYCSFDCRQIGEREQYQIRLAKEKRKREQKKWEGL